MFSKDQNIDSLRQSLRLTAEQLHASWQGVTSNDYRVSAVIGVRLWPTHALDNGLTLYTGAVRVPDVRDDGQTIEVDGVAWAWQHRGRWIGRLWQAPFAWFAENGPPLQDVLREASTADTASPPAQPARDLSTQELVSLDFSGGDADGHATNNSRGKPVARLTARTAPAAAEHRRQADLREIVEPAFQQAGKANAARLRRHMPEVAAQPTPALARRKAEEIAQQINRRQQWRTRWMWLTLAALSGVAIWQFTRKPEPTPAVRALDNGLALAGQAKDARQCVELAFAQPTGCPAQDLKCAGLATGNLAAACMAELNKNGKALDDYCALSESEVERTYCPPSSAQAAYCASAIKTINANLVCQLTVRK